jgi:hypothetical protein
MASQKGFWPIDRDPHTELMVDVDSANGAAIYVGDLVSVVAAGTVNASTAGDANIVLGSVLAVYDSNGNSAGHPNGSLSTKYLPASTAGKVLVALAIPGRRFRAQSATALTSAARFASSDHVVGSGSSTTGLSASTVNGADLNSGGQVFIVDLYPEPGNSYGANQSLIVIFNEGYLMGTGKSTGI